MYKGLDEKELARYCRQKDRLAEDELYNRYAARLYTLCRRYCGDPEEAKDLMMEGLVKALGKIGAWEYSGKGSLFAWISKVTLNTILDNLRKKRLKIISLDFYQNEDVPEPLEEGLDTVPREKLLEMISNLPEMRRAIFNLFCIEGYSHKEISEALGISEKNSASSLAKARRQLKKAINEYLKDHGQ